MLDLSFKVGQRYKICGLRPSMPKSYRDKILSMGLIPGAHFHVVRFAPFGDALQIEVNNFNLSLRANELRGLLLEALE